MDWIGSCLNGYLCVERLLERFVNNVGFRRGHCNGEVARHDVIVVLFGVGSRIVLPQPAVRGQS